MRSTATSTSRREPARPDGRRGRAPGARPEDRPFLVALACLVALAWLAMWLGGRSPAGRFLDHASAGAGAGDRAAMAEAVFVLGWVVMTVAMMLPASVPLVVLFHRMTRWRRDRAALAALLVLGYLAVWAVFGLAVRQADALLHDAARHAAWLRAHPRVVGSALLVVAGLYQFSWLRRHCLATCRHPLGFLMARWQGRAGWPRALLLGADHGLYCLGCCWALMLPVFALGLGNVAVMLLAGAVLAAERNLVAGRLLSAPLGALLLVWGGATALDAIT